MPVILTPNDILAPHQDQLNFLEVPIKDKANSNNQGYKNTPLAQAELATALGQLSSAWVNKLFLYFSPAATKATLHKQAFSICLKNAEDKAEQAQTSIQEAQSKHAALKISSDATKQAISMAQEKQLDLSEEILSSQSKINQNLADIKALEPILESAFTMIYYTVLAAKAMDPNLIKQVFDPQTQSLEAIVLNQYQQNYVNSVEVFIKASEIINAGTPQNLAPLKQELQEKLTLHKKLTAERSAFINNLPDEPSTAQLTKKALLCENLTKLTTEYKNIDSEIKAIEHKMEQANTYVKYHQYWSKLTQKDIDTAELIVAKKEANIAEKNHIDQLLSLQPKISPLSEQLSQIEALINLEQKKIVDNQLLKNSQQELVDFFKQESFKLESDSHDNTEHTMPDPLNNPALPLNPVNHVNHGDTIF